MPEREVGLLLRVVGGDAHGHVDLEEFSSERRNLNLELRWPSHCRACLENKN